MVISRRLTECWRMVEDYVARQSSKVYMMSHLMSPISAHHSHDEDALLWHRDLNLYKPVYKQAPDGLHNVLDGDLSMAVVQANASLEDQCQVKAGPFATLVGVYDGHGGPDAARFIAHRLFPKIEAFALESGGMSSEVLMQAVHAMEEEFVAFVQRLWRVKPRMASVGSCCLVGAICGSRVFIANLGDSRAVLGTLCRNNNNNNNSHSHSHGSSFLPVLKAVRLSEEHNASNAEVRKELKAQHPDDSHIVTLTHGVWRVKGIIQVSRSIGDVYLKSPEFNTSNSYSSSAAASSPISVSAFDKPILSAEPSLCEKELGPDDKFLIFASDGLWDMLSDQEVVDIVHKSPRKGIARRVVRCALKEAARKYGMPYSELKKVKPGARRNFHDDISVVVVYLSGGSQASHGHGRHMAAKYRSFSCNSAQERISCHVTAPRDISSSSSSAAEFLNSLSLNT